jgi:hypothetical protein
MAMSPLNIENSPVQRSTVFLVRYVGVTQKPAASPDNLCLAVEAFQPLL